MDVRRFVSYFVVPYIAVSLSGQEHNVSVGIVEWEYDAWGTVDGVGEERLREIVFVPDRILPVGMPGEARGQQTTCGTQENRLAGFGPGVTLTFLQIDVFH